MQHSTQSHDSTPSSERKTVVLVHGLWFRSAALKLLAARLKRRGYHVSRFDYPSVYGRAEDHSRALYRLIKRQRCRHLYLVGHSLGGLLILRTLNEYSDLQAERTVLLGSPVKGSGVARRLSRRWWGHWLVGANAELLGHGVRTPASTEIGVIAGSHNMGVGRVLGGVSGKGDGTVSISETRLQGAKDHIVLPVSHTGMVMSANVTRQIHAFLQDGEFQHAQVAVEDGLLK